MNPVPNPTKPSPLEAHFERLAARHGFVRLTAGEAQAFAAAPGDSLLLLTHDPLRAPEVLDLVVVLPEVLKSVPGRFRAAVLDPAQSEPLKARFGLSRWPAVVFQRAGEYVGAIEGMRDWDVFQREIRAMLERPAGRAPSVGIAVAADAGACH